MTDFVLRKAGLEATTGLTERQIRNLEQDGLFPKRFLIAPGGQAVGWSGNKVDAWLSDRIARRERPAHSHMAQPGQRIGGGPNDMAVKRTPANVRSAGNRMKGSRASGTANIAASDAGKAPPGETSPEHSVMAGMVATPTSDT